MPFARRPSSLWQLRTRTLALGRRTQLMAILNITPDSFSDGARFFAPDAAIARGLELLDAGADILDLGAESTRPNAIPLTATEEQARLLPVLEALHRERPQALLSVDTYHAETARNALAAGAEIINDVSGLLWDPSMPAVLAAEHPGIVLMHTRGTPQTWSDLSPLPQASVTPLVVRELAGRLAETERAGISRSSLVIDPGFGFGKLGPENLALLAHLRSLQSLGLPLLAGISRKGFLGQTVEAALAPEGRSAEFSGRLYPTLAANVAAVLGGAHLLRVHDLQPAAEAAAIADALLAEL